jgi:hypothetical protein
MSWTKRGLLGPTIRIRPIPQPAITKPRSIGELRQTMKALNKNKTLNVVAKTRFMCCGSCASYGIVQIMDERKKDGAVFWHKQSESADRVYVMTSAKKESKTRALMTKVVAFFREHGHAVEWEGDASKCILVRTLNVQ